MKLLIVHVSNFHTPTFPCEITCCDMVGLEYINLPFGILDNSFKSCVISKLLKETGLDQSYASQPDLFENVPILSNFITNTFDLSLCIF
jgi:hypothetical protein